MRAKVENRRAHTIGLRLSLPHSLVKKAFGTSSHILWFMINHQGDLSFLHCRKKNNYNDLPHFIRREINYSGVLSQCKWSATTYQSNLLPCKWSAINYPSNLLSCEWFATNNSSNLLPSKWPAINNPSNLLACKWFAINDLSNLLPCECFMINDSSNSSPCEWFAINYPSNLLPCEWFTTNDRRRNSPEKCFRILTQLGVEPKTWREALAEAMRQKRTADELTNAQTVTLHPTSIVRKGLYLCSLNFWDSESNNKNGLTF